jgi:hypothetical protein
MNLTVLLQQQAHGRTPRASTPPALRFDPNTAAVLQSGAWQCSAASTAWVLQTLGHPQSQDDVVALLGPSQINPDVGLCFGDGRALVALLHSLGLGARNGPVLFDDVLAMAGSKPLAMGGAAFYHWVGVRGRDGDTLALANPGPGYRGIHQTLSRTEFAALGPFIGVWVELTAGA